MPKIVKFLLFILIFVLASCKADSIIESSKSPEISSDSFFYPSSQYKFELGDSIEKTVPILKDRGVFIYSVEPELPPGFFIDDQNGGFGGVAIALSPKQIYTFKANLSGVGVEYRFQVEISVNEPIPQLLGYPQDPLKAVVGEFLSPVFPIVVGSVDSFSLEPALPASLFFDPLTGAIAGTALSLPYENIHYLSATNSGGTTTVPVLIKFTEQFPTSITYSSGSYSCLANLPCLIPAPALLPIGVANVEFVITPSLPPGYTFNPMTGEISANLGDLVLGSPATTYTVTASNIWGSQSASFTLETVLAAPVDLGYPITPITAFKDVELASPSPIIPGLPTPANAAIETYSIFNVIGPGGITNYLPGGLSLNIHTGEISGTPNAPIGNYSINILGTNALGSITSSIDFEILLQPTTMLNYPTFPSYILTGEEIPRYEPTYEGTTPDYYTLSSFTPDPLPPGLLFNESTGVFYGTPIQPVQGLNVTIRAVNIALPVNIISAPVNLTINISNPRPTSITYPQSTYSFEACSDVSIIPNILGGGPSSVFSTPPIDDAGQFPPTASSTGLSINQTTGEISGNVSTYYEDPKGYFITASNLDGSTPPTALTIITTPDTPNFSMDDFYPSRGIAQTQNMNLNSCFDKSDSVIDPVLPAEFSLSETNDIIYSGLTLPGISPYLVPRKNYSLTLFNSAGAQLDDFDMGLRYRLSSSRNHAESLIFDFDGDGNNDIVIADANCPIFVAGNCSQGHFSILSNINTDGEYSQIFSQSTQTIIGGFPVYNHFEYMHDEDMDSDLYSDIIYYDRFQLKIVIMKNNGGLNISHLAETSIPTAATDIVYADVTGDNIDDIIVVDGSSDITVYQYTGGAFSSTTHSINNLAVGISSIAVTHINNDNFIDLVLIDEDDSSLCPIKATADNVFELDCTEKIVVADNPKSIYSAPLSAGNNDDLVVIHQGTVSSVSILRNDGNDFATKTISTPPALNKLVKEKVVTFGDLNADGTHDIILTSQEGVISHLHVYNGALLFSSPAAATNIEYSNIRSINASTLYDNQTGLLSCHEDSGLGYCQIDFSRDYLFSF